MGGVAMGEVAVCDTTLAVLQGLRADTRHQPLRRRLRRWRGRRVVAGQLESGQGPLGCLAVVQAADALALLVEEWLASLAAGRGVVPAVGLLPVPGRAVRLATGLLAWHGGSLPARVKDAVVRTTGAGPDCLVSAAWNPRPRR